MTAQVTSGSIKGTLSAVLKNVLTDSSENTFNVSGEKSITLTNGTTTNKADRGLQSKSRVLAAAASEVLDLYDLASLDLGAGAGQDPLGLGVQNVELVGLMVENVGDSGNDGDLIVGGEGSAAAWSDFIQSDTGTLRIPPIGFMLIGCGRDPAWLIADVSNHLLKFAASGDSVKYNVYWVTRSA